MVMNKTWKFIIFIILEILILIIVYALLTKNKISPIFAIIVSILATIAVLYLIYLKNIGPLWKAKPKLSMDIAKEEIKKRAGQWGLHYITKAGRSAKKTIVPDLEWTGNQFEYNFRGEWFARVEIYIKRGPLRGIRTIEVCLSRGKEEIRNGHLHIKDCDLRQFEIDHRKYSPAPAVSRFSQTLNEAIEAAGGDYDRAVQMVSTASGAATGINAYNDHGMMPGASVPTRKYKKKKRKNTNYVPQMMD